MGHVNIEWHLHGVSYTHEAVMFNVLQRLRHCHYRKINSVLCHQNGVNNKR